jgi:dTDP-4-dehydrorhamnose 3,5-epimerase-like enzyme
MLSLDQGAIPRWNQRLREKSKTFKVWTNNNLGKKNQALLFASSMLKQ